MSIPGLCRFWCRPTSGDNRYWTPMTYAARDYFKCLHLVKLYREKFPQMEYVITADHDMCRPVG